MKTCEHCKKEKNLVKFAKSQRWCRVCCSIAHKEWREKNKERLKVYFRDYYENNREKYRRNKDSRVPIKRVKRESNEVCKVDACNKKVISKGICNMHYLRMWRYGRYTKHIKIVGAYTNNRKFKSIFFMHRKRFGGLRESVLERDNYCCQVCGMTNDQHKEKWNCEITIDHKDGSGRYVERANNTLSNLWTLCMSCHSKKDWCRRKLSQNKPVPDDLVSLYRLL